MRILTSFGQISVDTFLKDYWQKKPLHQASVFPDIGSLLSGDELAGLSLEDEAVSRLIVERPDQDQWQVTHGPLTESDFSELPEKNWSLLVQHVDHWVPEIADLLRQFHFLPAWRLEDIMVSFATDNGGVGPHFDYYDVFLIQAHGQRRWRLGQQCDAQTPIKPNVPMKQITAFDTHTDIITQPGDILYVPAGMAHWGEAIGDCMTYSVGFRAPSYGEIWSEMGLQLEQSVPEHIRLKDTTAAPVTAPHTLSADFVSQLQEQLLNIADDHALLTQTLAQLVTKTDVEFDGDEDMAAFEQAQQVQLDDRSRAVITENKDTSHAETVINGESVLLSLPVATALTTLAPISIETLSPSDLDAITHLYRLGYVTTDA